MPRAGCSGKPDRTRRRRTGLAILSAAAVLAAGTPLLGDGQSVRGGAVLVPIHGEINDIQAASVKRRVDEALGAGAKIIVFEMNTPGGMVTSALDICHTIKGLPDELHTVAWVRPMALSAGAMISVSCREIVMSRASRIGDCAPIMIDPTGGLQELPATERAKAESPILQEFRDSAGRNGYNALLLRAMVTVGAEVWWLENTGTGEREFVDGEEKTRRIDDAAAEKRAWKLVEKFSGPDGREYDVAQPVDHKETLLTLSQTEAVGYGLARGIATDEEDLRELLGLLSPPLRLEITGWESFALWLNSALVRGILLTIFLIGGYIEFQKPGLVLPGVVALIALAIFLAAPYAAGLADIWTIVLMAIGLILLAVEIFVLPGFGIWGLLGILFILAAFLGTFVPPEPGAPPFSLPALKGTWDLIKRGILVMSASIAAAIVGLLFLIRYLPKMPISRSLLSENPRAEALALSDPFPGVARVGDVGVVTGALRPGGQGRFGNEIVEIQSQGEYVPAGTRVQVIKREGPLILVRPLPAEA
jgi:membrane-bound serine protease (ClpP class)